MRLTIDIQLPDDGTESARILRDVADTIEGKRGQRARPRPGPGTAHRSPLRDVRGAIVGDLRIEAEDAP